MALREDRYLEKRGELFYYARRVPKALAHLESAKIKKRALRTRDLETARERRDLLEKADSDRWAHARLTGLANPRANGSSQDSLINARARAGLAGHPYRPLAEQIEAGNLSDMLARLRTLKGREKERHLARAVLGLVAPPVHTISEALQIYISDIATREIRSKSAGQRMKWEMTRERSIAAFTQVCGPTDMDSISREHAMKFHAFWRDRILPSEDKNDEDAAPSYKPNTANKQLGHLRKLYTDYWTYHGQENRENPFRNLSFPDHYEPTTLPFTDDWVRSQILAPKALTGLSKETRLIVPVLIETGCRISELVNLLPENIRLHASVPHIRIWATLKRELKTPSSKRDIPLVGVALLAMQQAPIGFPKYRDKATHLSNTLMKSFRSRGLLPTPNHKIYSFRHAFEKRMLEAGLDYGLRCTLMGHKDSRPRYGDGGSLEFRRNELLKIVHPVPKGFKRLYL